VGRVDVRRFQLLNSDVSMAADGQVGRDAHAGKLCDIGANVARVAHELAGPLSLIVGSLDALSKHAGALVGYVEATATRAGGDAELQGLRRHLNVDYAARNVRDLVEICREGTGRLEHVIRQLRSHGRHLGEATSVAMVSLPEVLRGAVRMVQAARPTPIETEVAELPPVSGTKDLLGEVFVNLIGNACEAVATRPGGRVWIVAGLRAEPEPTVVVRVCDNGPGVPQEHRARIFEPFFTTKVSQSGLGLGLVIAREIIEAHGGTVALATPSTGAELVVTLPVPVAAL